MLANVSSATLMGVEGRPVSVEVHVGPRLPGFSLVGLPDAACREAHDRVRAAFASSGLPWPDRHVTVNLAPVGVRKGGSGLDLPIAVGVMVASGTLQAEAVAGVGFVGELGLDGSIRPVPGLVPLVAAIDTPDLVVASEAVCGAKVVGKHRVRCATGLSELAACIRGEMPWPAPPPPEPEPPAPAEADLADVRGQAVGRLALEVAAAGGHHLLLCGPPGAGKSMLARRLPGLLPPLEQADALAVTTVHSAAGLALPPGGLIRRPPIRAPHHGASPVALIGGGTGWMRPGEASLAHAGVLVLDEMAEFAGPVLDALRQPLEEGVVRVCRARTTAVYPARVLLVGTTNPCPCGRAGPAGRCRCTSAARARYLRRLSGPLLDRFDLRVLVGPVEAAEVMSGQPGESSEVVAARVVMARARARERGVRCNAELASSRLDALAPLTPDARRRLESAVRSGELSGRGLHRVRRVALTLSDLAGSQAPVSQEHVCLALGLRAELIHDS
ncbi:MAG: YifB family Mg chelatase-like AAA ATPase [Acidimicrobiales bacterium]